MEENFQLNEKEYKIISNLNPEYYEINSSLENTLDLKNELEKIINIQIKEKDNE